MAPPLIAALPAALLAAGATGAMIGAGAMAAGTFTVFGSALLGSSLVAGGITLGLGVASNLLAGKPATAQSLVGPQKSRFGQDGQEQRRWGYGRCAEPGSLKYWETRGTDNKELWLVCAFHDTRIDAIESFYANDAAVGFSGAAATGAYSGFMWRWDKDGQDGQTVETNLETASSVWGTNHRLDGIAYYVWKLIYSQTVFPNGIPDPLVVFRARRLWDPRKDVNYGGTGSHLLADETTWEWTNNAALCLLDYLRGVKMNGVFIGGCKCPISLIDAPSFVAAANICDENVALDAGGTEDRYTINGMVGSLEDKASVVESMLQAMAGVLVTENGILKLYAGAATTATVTLTDDDLAGALTVHPSRSIQDKHNIVTSVRYDRLAKEGTADVPPLRVAAYIAEDGGLELERENRHRFTDSNATAQRLDKIILSNEREQLVIEGVFKPKVAQLGAFATFLWTSEAAGYTNQKMRLMDRQRQPDGSFRIVARKETDAKYGWAESTEELAAPSFQTNVGFDASVVTDPNSANMSVSVISNAGTAGLKVTVDTPANTFVREILLEWVRNGQADWSAAPSIIPDYAAADSSGTVLGLANGSAYNIRVAFKTTFGVSGWTQLGPFTINTTGGGTGTVPITSSYASGTGNEIVPSGSTSVEITVVGGGGGGGSGASTPGGGGSGGTASRVIAIDPSDWGATLAWAVGAGGGGHVHLTDGDGSSGGNSTVTGTLVAHSPNMAGNGGAFGTSSTDGDGGTASGGTTNTTGDSGSVAPFATHGSPPGGGGGPADQDDNSNAGNGAPGECTFVWT